VGWIYLLAAWWKSQNEMTLNFEKTGHSLMWDITNPLKNY
jgi:hypothetical protein